MLNRHGTSHGWTKHTTQILDLKVWPFYTIINRLSMTEGMIHHTIVQPENQPQ